MQKNNVILVGGAFDVLHFGHIQFLKQAKALGDYLIVAIESDKNIKRLKGEKRPIFGQNKRREMLLSLKSVDEVIILKDEMTDQDYMDLVTRVRPLIIAVTLGDPIIEKKKDQAEKVGAKLVEIPRVNSPSTTQIVRLLGLE